MSEKHDHAPIIRRPSSQARIHPALRSNGFHRVASSLALDALPSLIRPTPLLDSYCVLRPDIGRRVGLC
jgi:hypothetical protein